MNKTSALAVLLTTISLPMAALSQQSIVFDGSSAASDSVSSIDETVQNDFNRSTDRGTFGNDGRALGWYGSLSGSATATSGNTDTANLGIGARFGVFDGTNGRTDHDQVSQRRRLNQRQGAVNVPKRQCLDFMIAICIAGDDLAHLTALAHGNGN